MIDAVVAADPSPGTIDVAAQPDAQAIRITIDGGSDQTIARYQVLAATGVCAPPQSLAWLSAWRATVAPDVIAVTVTQSDRMVFALILEITAKGACRIARFPGGTHANGNFALAEPDWLAMAQPQTFRDIARAIAKARPDVDVLVLERLLPEHMGLRNPLLALPHMKSPNISLAVDLAGGFAQVVSGPSGKRKRKKHRTQARKYESAGGFRRLEAQTEGDVDRLLDAFFEMKAARFRKAGIVNVFAEREVQSFFRRLFRDALPLTPRPFTLHALEVGGKPRAVTGSSQSADRLICEFGAIADDDIAHASPGEFLFFENIEEACAEGLPIYDFSVGDEPYKRLWCDIETQHLDVLVPLTVKGKAVAGSMRLFAALKARIKNNPTVWRLAKALRQRAVGQKAAEQDSSEE